MRYLTPLITLLLTLPAHGESQPELKAQLVNMAQQSQKIHTRQQDSEQKVINALAVDITNLHTRTLKEIVQLQGWPTKVQVGAEGVNAAFVLVKHAKDTAFQQEMLPLIIQSFMQNQGLSGEDVAIFTDKLALAQGKKQVFGTQYEWQNNQLSFKSIEDPDSVDKLRAQMNLPPLAVFKKQIENND